MKLWTCTGFAGVGPTGTAAIVIANDEEQAVRMLEDLLATHGLRQQIKPEMLKRVSMGATRAVMLCDGVAGRHEYNLGIPTIQEVRDDGGPCECSCHNKYDDDADDAERPS